MAKDELKNSIVKSDGIKGCLAVWLFGLIYFSFQGGVYAIGFWLPIVVQPGTWGGMLMVGIICALADAAATLFMIFMCKSADVNNERRWHLAFPMIMSAVGLIMATNSGGSSLLLLFGLAIATMGAFTALLMFWPLSSSYLSASGAVAGVAIINSVGQIVGFASPYFSGGSRIQRTRRIWHGTRCHCLRSSALS